MALATEYHEELEMDLLALNLDILDFWRGDLSLRRLDVIIRHLSPTSYLYRSARPELAAEAAWSPAAYILASLFDITARAHFKDPQPIVRPLEALKLHRARVERLAALEAQAERNRLRDLAEIGA